MKPLTEGELIRRTDKKLLFYSPTYQKWYVGTLRTVHEYWCRFSVEKSGSELPYYYTLHGHIFENTPENKLDVFLTGGQIING